MLEHCDIDKDYNVVVRDGTKKKTIGLSGIDMKPMPYDKILRRVLNQEGKCEIIVNLVRFKALLETVEGICNDASGELPVKLEFCGDHDIIIRGFNAKLGQRVIGCMTAYKHKDSWIKDGVWEKKLKSLKRFVIKVKKGLRRKKKLKKKSRKV